MLEIERRTFLQLHLGWVSQIGIKPSTRLNFPFSGEFPFTMLCSQGLGLILVQETDPGTFITTALSAASARWTAEFSFRPELQT